MLFSYGNDTDPPSRSMRKKTLRESMLPDTNPWVMCINKQNREYYINILTHQITYEKPLCFIEYENRLLNKEREEAEKKIELLTRKNHIHEGKLYEELYASTIDTSFIVNPKYTYKKGDTVWYIPNNRDPLIKSTVVDVHHDKPPFYSIRYKIKAEGNDEYVEKNTTLYRLRKCS